MSVDAAPLRANAPDVRLAVEVFLADPVFERLTTDEVGHEAKPVELRAGRVPDHDAERFGELELSLVMRSQWAGPRDEPWAITTFAVVPTSDGWAAANLAELTIRMYDETPVTRIADLNLAIAGFDRRPALDVRLLERLVRRFDTCEVDIVNVTSDDPSTMYALAMAGWNAIDARAVGQHVIGSAAVAALSTQLGDLDSEERSMAACNLAAELSRVLAPGLGTNAIAYDEIAGRLEVVVDVHSDTVDKALADVPLSTWASLTVPFGDRVFGIGPALCARLPQGVTQRRTLS